MNEKDIMLAVNDLDEELLNIEEKPKKLRGSWKVLIAAALIMVFSVTAYAIGNITTSYNTKVVDANGLWQLYYGDIEEAEFYEMTVEYKLEPRKISEEFYSDCVAALKYNYETIQRTYRDYEGKEYILREGDELWASLSFYSDETDEINSYTVEELEEYTGLELCISEEMREGINKIAALRKAGKTNMQPCNITMTGKKVSEEQGGFVPLGFTISFDVDYDGKGNFVHGTAYVSLSEEATTASDYWNSFEKEGKWTEKIMKTDSGREIYFIHNDPEEGFKSHARACWTENGIGYVAYTDMAYDWERKDEAVKHLKPFVENIE
ncbi:MAG: hypothetical protein IJ306_06615 [Oscillospiraceae bacterium]|nr:hypothetical protein [Oscillospiraceae bacterium]